MAYIKHNFEDGQVLEASLLNKMDDQIALNEAGLNDVIEDIEAVDTKATEAKAIAEGKSTGYVFDTVSAMNTWITSHKSELKLGDNLYIKATDVPDYWWDGTSAQELETQKVDLAGYYTKTETDTKFYDKTSTNILLNAKATTEQVNAVDTKLGGLKFGKNATNEYGYYKSGSTTLTPFVDKEDLEPIDVTEDAEGTIVVGGNTTEGGGVDEEARAAISQLSESITEISEYAVIKKGKEGISFSGEILTTTYPINTNGSNGSSSVACGTAFIDVSEYVGMNLTYTALDYRTSAGARGVWLSHAFYSDKTYPYNNVFISGRQTELVPSNPSYQTVTVTIPENAKYVRFTFLTEIKSEFSAVISAESVPVKTTEVIEDIYEQIDELKNRPVVNKVYPVFGSAKPYTEDVDISGVPSFANTQKVYEAYDALCSGNPHIVRNADLGMDASGTYPIAHYTISYMRPSYTSGRGGSGTDEYDPTDHKIMRICLESGIHGTERFSVVSTYLAVKEILESTGEWADFIRNNCIIDIIPCSNPWGYTNVNANNANGYNLNRTFKDDIQPENTLLMNYVTEYKQKGLVGILSLHTSGTGTEPKTEPYFVARNDYKYVNNYIVMASRISHILQAMGDNVMPNLTGENHFVVWDSATEGGDGRFHWYINNEGLLGSTQEIYDNYGKSGAVMQKAIILNIIQEFILMGAKLME